MNSESVDVDHYPFFNAFGGSWRKLNSHEWLNDSQNQQEMDHESSHEEKQS